MAPRPIYDHIPIPSQAPNVVIDPSHSVPLSAPPHVFSTTVTSTPQRVTQPPPKKMVLSYEPEERKPAPEYVYSPGSSPEPSPAPSNDQKPDIIE